MKIKRHLSLLLVMIMIFVNTNIVFAANNNQVSKNLSYIPVETVLVEDNILPQGLNSVSGNNDIRYKINGSDLILYPQTNITSGSAIVISLQNADWFFRDNTMTKDWDGTNTYDQSKGTLINNTYHRNGNYREVPYTLTFSDALKDRAYLTITENVSYNDDKEVIIPLISKIKEGGNVRVSVESGTSGIRGSSHIYATAGDSKTKTYVSDYVYSYDNFNLDKLIIKELQIGTIKSGTFKITAPSYITFSNVSKIRLYADYGLKLNNYNIVQKNDNVLEVEIDVDASTNINGALYFTDINFWVDDVAGFNDLEFKISNVRGNTNITEETFKIGNRYDYNLSLHTKNVPTIISGSYEGNQSNPDYSHRTELIKIQENIINSWWGGRRLEFSLPKEVKIRKLEIVSTRNINTDITGTYYIDNRNSNVKVYDSSFSISGIDFNRSERAQVEFYLWLSVESGYEDDIKLSISGSGISHDDSIIIARSKNPITISTTVCNAKIGYQSNQTSDFTIEETASGMLKKNSIVNISLTDNISQDIFFNGNIKATVIEGDLKISNLQVRNGNISFQIDRASSKRSVIQFTDVAIKVDHRVPETIKPYQLVVWGSAIAANYGKEKDQFDTAGLYADYVNITLKDKWEVSVKAGEPFYTINDNSYAMDVSPYIQNDRMMVPVRFIAESLGASVQWDGNNRVVTIFIGDRIAQFKIDSSEINVNGAKFNMDCQAEIRNDRTFVPFRYVGNALGIEVDYVDGRAVYTK